MSPPPPKRPRPDAAEALVAVAPLATRWIERLLAAHEPPLSVTQYLALRAIARDGVSGSELAGRAAGPWGRPPGAASGPATPPAAPAFRAPPCPSSSAASPTPAS